MRVPRQISTRESAIAAYTMPKLTPPSVNCKNSVTDDLLETQVVLTECLVGREHGGVFGDHHPADVEHHPEIGDGQRAARVLLDQHHGQPGLVPQPLDQ